MARTYLVRGMLAGLLAGLCAFTFARLFAEPQIAKAEHFERQIALELHRPEMKPLVSRDVQDTVGLGTGVAVAGIALGGLFGLSFAAVYRRLSDARAKTTAGLLAGAGFVGLFLVPFLKYPANPPAVGNPDTIGHRTAEYFLLIAVGVLAVGLATIARQQFTARFGTWNATLLALAVLLGIVALSYVVMPGIDEVPSGFPASVLWHFRLASAGTQVVLWATLGLVFGHLTERRESAESGMRAVLPVG